MVRPPRLRSLHRLICPRLSLPLSLSLSLPSRQTPLVQDYLKFRLHHAAAEGGGGGEPGGLDTEDSPFLAKLDPNVLAYLDVYRSHPAFTSAITMALFEASTLATAPGGIGGGE